MEIADSMGKLRRFWRWKRDRGEDLASDAPLFCNQSRNRISKRRIQLTWATWQWRAGFDRVYSFHALGTRRSPTSTGRRGTCSWRRASLAT
jgi:site-specific recombinase XerC